MGVNGKIHISKVFDIPCGVIQGDIVSPIFFIIALDQLIRSVDTSRGGVNVGKMNEIRVLGYADDLAMCTLEVEAMTERLTIFADAAKKNVDMYVKLAETWTQHKEKSHKVECDFAGAGCTARFKSKRAMYIHRNHCQFHYDTTDEASEIETLVDVFGHANR